MILNLPLKTQKLVEHYSKLKIGPFSIQCPYFQNITNKKAPLVFVGKGLPEDIEREAVKCFRKNNKEIKNYYPSSVKYFMLMAGLGIDCSGFVVRVIESLLLENGLGTIREKLKPNNKSIKATLRHHLRTYTNLSADALTSKTNCFPIEDLNSIIPGDLIRFGKQHVAVITKVKKEKNQVKKITYWHSTSDYSDKYGVRKGDILINKPEKKLEGQIWNEIYQNGNWSYQDFITAKQSDRGTRRLKILALNQLQAKDQKWLKLQLSTKSA